MKTLSLWQPWAEAVALGVKRLETRSWSTTYRGPLVIHAARRNPPPRRGEFAELYQLLREQTGRTREQLARGALLAVVTLADVRPVEEIEPPSDLERAFGDFSPGRFAWVLVNVRQLERPIPQRGFQGLFETYGPELARHAAASAGLPPGRWARGAP